MDQITKNEIDGYFETIKERLNLENLKKFIEPFDSNEDALEYLEDILEDIDGLVNDAEEYIGTTILNLDDD